MAPGPRILLAGAESGPYPLHDAAAALRDAMAARVRQGPGGAAVERAAATGAPARLFTLDLAAGPRVTRAKAALGIGWHARDHVRAIARTGPAAADPAASPGAPSAVDLVIELGGTAHHLLGLGRVGVPSARLVAPPWHRAATPSDHEDPRTSTMAPLDAIDRLAADEGACLLIPEPVVRPAEAPTTGDRPTPMGRALADRAWLALPYDAAADAAAGPPWEAWWPRIIDALLGKEPWRRIVPRP